MVLPHEAIALFRYLQSRMPAAGGADRAHACCGSTASSATRPARACAFLVDGECAAYEVRPSACAAYHSLSRERCEQSFQDPRGADRHRGAGRSLQVVAAALEEGLSSALHAQGLSSDCALNCMLPWRPCWPIRR